MFKRFNNITLLLVVSFLFAFIFNAISDIKSFAAISDAEQSNSVGLDGTVKGSPPSNSPTITFPSSSQSFSQNPIRVSGICTGSLLVKAYNNSVFVGSVQCANGAYSLSIDLFSGTNNILTRQYDALDQSSPDSNIVSVSFNASGFNNSAPRVSLSSDYSKRGANPGESLSWPLLISGGTKPYAVSVDWGDGFVELISLSENGKFNISHKYTSSGTYVLIIKTTDSLGNSAFLQLVAVSNGLVTQDSQSTNSQQTVKQIVLLWPLILAFILVIISFWLGSRSRLTAIRRRSEADSSS